MQETRSIVPRLLLAVAAALAPGIFRSGVAVAQPFSENFDSVAGLAATGWVQTNNSSPAGATGWFQGNTGVFTSQGGAASSYAAANLNGATFGGNVSDWLITPTLSNLQNGEVLTFFTRTEPAAPAADRLEVRLSTNGSSANVGGTDASVGDFTILLASVNPTLAVGGYPTTWTLVTATLSGLPAGASSGRIAFRHFVPNTASAADTIGLDTLALTGTAGGATLLSTLAPCRLLDTRRVNGSLGGPALAPSGSPDRLFTITGVCGIPVDAKAVSVNVTVTNVAASGTLLVYRGDGAPTTASTISFRPGITRANNTQLQLAFDGTGSFKVQNSSAGALDFIVDVNGFYR